MSIFLLAWLELGVEKFVRVGVWEGAVEFISKIFILLTHHFYPNTKLLTYSQDFAEKTFFPHSGNCTFYYLKNVFAVVHY